MSLEKNQKMGGETLFREGEQNLLFPEVEY
jgi:hypothetical protein